jgi:ABC-type transport system substrate-binding protein/class 3 adenylate cyclase
MAEPAGERRIVAVLMADIAGSTTIGEALGPERSKFLFDEVARLMGQEVLRFGGTVAQLTGDGLYALFGAPAAHEDDSERAVRAALAIHDALAGFAGDVQEAYGVSLAARVAVNTGPVVLTTDDAPDEARYNALGDTVNTAARLQTLADQGGVAVGALTARQVEGLFELEPMGEVELKGKSALVAAFRVAGERAAQAAARTPFVGRERELADLGEALEGVAEGRGAIVSVIGEPGIGKSRLVAQAGQRVAGRVASLTGHAVSYSEGIPYWPVRDLLRSWLGLGLSDPEAHARIELKATLAPLLGDAATDAYPFLANLLGLVSDREAEAALREFSRDSVQRQTHDAVSDLVRALAREQPLCLALEDLYWADESTLSLVESLFPLVEEEALGLVLLYRSDPERRSWQLGELARRRYRHRYTELELGPLEPEEALALVGATLPEEAAALLLDRSGGNPFFMEEALQDLVERGALRRENGRYELAIDAGELLVPTVVQEALQARLDRLSPESREVATVASVVGRSFGFELLEQLAPRETLVPALSELQRLDLVVEERRRPALEYRFRHGLVREAAYASLTENRRRTLHRNVGEALEDLQEEEQAEAYGLLARHFAEADEPERAAGYLLKAGDAARGIDSEEEALGHYRRALGFLERLGDEDRARDTLLRIALTHHLAFDFEHADQAYAEAFARHVPEQASEVLTERLETASRAPDALTPGHTYWSPAWQFIPNLFRGLVDIDPDLNVVPALAESFRVSADGLSYRFGLRADARWSDGVPITAQDFAYTWTRMRHDEDVLTAHLLEPIEEAIAHDERTLEVRLREPRSYFLYLLAMPPAFCWPRHRCEELGDDWRAPANLVTSGPFTLAEYDGEHALLRANPNWPLARGNVREVHYTFKGADETIEAWTSGCLDLAVSWIKAPENVEAESVPMLDTGVVAFRADAPPFDDARVRKAFSHAIDRERVVAESRIIGAPAVHGGLLPPSMPAHSHRAGLPYDLELARRLLAEAGYPGGRDLPELTLVARFEDSGLAAARQWAELGARVRVEPLPRGASKAAEAHFAFDGWEADYPDPDGFFREIFEGTAVPLHRDAEVESLLAQARSLADRQARIRLFNEVERLWITEQAALLPIVYLRRTVLRRPWVDGFWASPFSTSPLDQVVVRPRTDSAPRRS